MSRNCAAFVADASHELRTPLSGIKLLTDSVLQTNDIDIATAREFMRDIAAEIDRLTRIAEKLLILTKLDSETSRANRFRCPKPCLTRLTFKTHRGGSENRASMRA